MPDPMDRTPVTVRLEDGTEANGWADGWTTEQVHVRYSLAGLQHLTWVPADRVTRR